MSDSYIRTVLKYFDDFHDEDARTIVERNISIHESLSDIVFKHSVYSLFSCPLTKSWQNIERYGDIILGFYAESPVEFAVRANFSTLQTITLDKGEFQYALFGAYPLLVISTAHVLYDIKMLRGEYSDVHIIYAHLDEQGRYILAKHSFTYQLPDDTGYYGISLGSAAIFKEKESWMDSAIRIEPYTKRCVTFTDLKL